MPSKDAGQLVLWPHYFNAKRSRATGRRVSKELAVVKPDAAWVHSAAKKAGLKAELDEKAIHPSRPWDKVGCVFVAMQDDRSKEQVLRAVAQNMAQD